MAALVHLAAVLAIPHAMARHLHLHVQGAQALVVVVALVAVHLHAAAAVQEPLNLHRAQGAQALVVVVAPVVAPAVVRADAPEVAAQDVAHLVLANVKGNALDYVPQVATAETVAEDARAGVPAHAAAHAYNIVLAPVTIHVTTPAQVLAKPTAA